MTDKEKSINETPENEINKISIWERDNLTQTLIFGSDEKVLSKEDKEMLVWGTFWIEYYGEIDYYKITGIRSYDGSVEMNNLKPTWPEIRWDENELADILREWWYNLIHEWRSGFASRNSYIITREDKKEKKSAPLLIVGNDVVWTGKIYEGKALAESEVQAAKDALEAAKKELQNRRNEKMKAYIEETKKGDISIISVWWWPEDFSFWEIPENYEIISERRTACTQDYRRNISHTYEVILIDKAIFQGKWFVKIQVPDEYKGIVIGKWWSKIRGLSEKFACTISVK